MAVLLLARRALFKTLVVFFQCKSVQRNLEGAFVTGLALLLPVGGLIGLAILLPFDILFTQYEL